jgi:hypothetical protein
MATDDADTILRLAGRVRTDAIPVSATGATGAGATADPAGAVIDRSDLASQQLPIAVGPDSVLWRADDDRIADLAYEYATQQLADAIQIADALTGLAQDATLLAAPDGQQLPAQVAGAVTGPDGTPAARVQVALAADTLDAAQLRTATAVTAEDGTFTLGVPAALRTAAPAAVKLRVTGANRTVAVPLDLDDLQANPILPPVRLPQPVAPLPLGLLDELGRIISAAPTTADGTTETSVPTVTVGEDECQVVFRKDASQDRFPYQVLFRLTDPALSAQTLVLRFPVRDELPDRIMELAKRKATYAAYSEFNPAAALVHGLGSLELHLVPSVPIDRPISVDAFRDGLARPAGLGFSTVPIASSLAIGYVVQMAQRWTPLGLALGDLVYSLPLAPGAQQRIAVVERTATSAVFDSETLDTAEAESFSERDDTSALATFASAFSEAASGGSHYDTESSSFSVAAAVGGGGIFPFGAMAGGVSTSYGRASASGNTNTWMQGARNTTSNAAQNTHSSVQRQAAARRHSARTAMRLATASESDKVVTKVIANHNRTRALTMQYWEVLRLFDITTAVEGVDLVCMVPLDVIKFLPPGQPEALSQAPGSRAAVMARYDQLLGHADVLQTVVPPRLRQGLSLINEFAADPNATVQSADGDAEDNLTMSVTGTFCDFEDVYCTVISRRGLRSGPVLLVGNPPAVPTGSNAFGQEAELFGWLRTRRADMNAQTTLQGTFTLPPSIPRQDVVGFEISRRFRRLDYQFAQPTLRDLKLAGVNIATFAGIAEIAAQLAKPAPALSYDAGRLEQELGGPRVTAFKATVSPSVTFADTRWNGAALELPRTPQPIASRMVPPMLSYSSILEIEKTLQWTIRNTMTCTLAVFRSLTAEERAVMLERYGIEVPDAQNGGTVIVPLLSCVTNNVLGYFGNSMVLPFMIPAEITALTATEERAGLTTADVTGALLRFHTDGFEPPRSTVALPTKGVLGEAVLGHCPSAEKIDLTRFWHWQDSPGDEATAISPVTVPTGSLTAGLTAPSALPGMAPIITNFNTNPVPADSSLAASLITAAASQKDFDVASLTNAAALGTLTGKTLDTAEAARKDALATASQLAQKAMDAAVQIKTGKAPGKDDKDAKDGKTGTGSGSGSGGSGSGSGSGGSGSGGSGSGGSGSGGSGSGGSGSGSGGSGSGSGGSGSGGSGSGGSGSGGSGSGGSGSGTGSGSGSGGSGSGGSGSGSGGSGSGGSTPAPPADPLPVTLIQAFFAHDSSELQDLPPGAGAVTDQMEAIVDAIAAATAQGASAITVRGYASPEGTAAHNIQLAHDRADALIGLLTAGGLSGVVRAEGGVLAGPQGDWPRLRRADATITAWS